MTAPEVCRCGHAADRHLPYVQEMQDACSGGTPGFCGCPGYRPAAPDTTGGELREAIAEDVARRLFEFFGMGLTWDEDATPQLREVFTRRAYQLLALPALRDLLAERDNGQDCGHESWGGLMRLLDEHWPDDIFPTKYANDPKRDAGPRIVALTRLVDKLTAERDKYAAQVRAVEGLAEEFARIDAETSSDNMSHYDLGYGDAMVMAHDRLRRALGTPTTGGGE